MPAFNVTIEYGQCACVGQPELPSTHTPLAVQVQGSDGAATGDGDLFVGPADAATDGVGERPNSGWLGRPRA